MKTQIDIRTDKNYGELENSVNVFLERLAEKHPEHTVISVQLTLGPNSDSYNAFCITTVYTLGVDK